MRNWARTVEFEPERFSRPDSIEKISDLVKHAKLENKNIRMIGSGHSWTKLIETSDILISLDEYQGITSVNSEEKTVEAKGGTKLGKFNSAAFDHGFHMENMGDVDKQSLAGAASTGTHGTGVDLQSISNQISALTIVDGHGAVKRFDKNKNAAELSALGVSLGSLGVITDIKLQMEDKYKLNVKTAFYEIDDLLSDIDQIKSQNRHTEFFFFPVSEWATIKTMNKSSETAQTKGTFEYIKGSLIDNWLYEKVNRWASSSKKYEFYDRIMRKFESGRSSNTYWAHEAYPADRSVRFMEMEYGIPVKFFHQAFNEIREKIKELKIQTLFPIEVRFTKADNLWLSPCYERDTVYFAFHSYIEDEYMKYFTEMEQLLAKYEGRPHWGKWHSLVQAQLSQLYPKWDEFRRIRTEFDPEDIFINDCLKKLFIK